MSRKGAVWRVDILQEAETTFSAVGELTFEGDSPLKIEWEERGKEETICGSSATLRVESPGDRTYEDMYSIEPGRIRADIYRNGSLYWSGTLDPEFYEEPYERARNYPVRLTFSDFGILERKKYALEGTRDLDDIVAHAIEQSGILTTGTDTTMVSTSLVAPQGASGTSLERNWSLVNLGNVAVASANFTDEEGERMNMKEVIEGVLRPLGMRLTQRLGKIWIYDINGLYSKGERKAVAWDGDSSTMGTDKVLNNVRITWSPYTISGKLSDWSAWVAGADPNETELNNCDGRAIGDCRIWSYHCSPELKDWLNDGTDAGFTLWTSRNHGMGMYLTDENLRFFKIVPQFDGTECEGVAIEWPMVTALNVGGKAELSLRQWAGHTSGLIAGTDFTSVGAAMMRSYADSIPEVKDGVMLRLTVEMMLDPRINFFEEGVDYNSAAMTKSWMEQWKKYGNIVYVPVCVMFRPDDGGADLCWDNRQCVAQGGNSVKSTVGMPATYGEWKTYTESGGTPGVWGYLGYYNAEDYGTDCGVLGWKKNRQCFPSQSARLTSAMRHCPEGQYIPYPPKAGKVWVEILGGGWLTARGGLNPFNQQVINYKELWQKYNWLLMKLPEMEIVNDRTFDKDIDTGDVVYSAEINPNAKDGMDIDTICGTCEGGKPTAKGAYLNALTGEQIERMTRGGRTTQVEELLIGTLFSQFGERRTKLSGEMEILPDAPKAYTEGNQAGKLFMLTGDIQDAQADTSEGTLVEIRPDEYEKRQTE